MSGNRPHVPKPDPVRASLVDSGWDEATVPGDTGADEQSADRVVIVPPGAAAPTSPRPDEESITDVHALLSELEDERARSEVHVVKARREPPRAPPRASKTGHGTAPRIDAQGPGSTVRMRATDIEAPLNPVSAPAPVPHLPVPFDVHVPAPNAPAPFDVHAPAPNAPAPFDVHAPAHHSPAPQLAALALDSDEDSTIQFFPKSGYLHAPVTAPTSSAPPPARYASEPPTALNGATAARASSRLPTSMVLVLVVMSVALGAGAMRAAERFRLIEVPGVVARSEKKAKPKLETARATPPQTASQPLAERAASATPPQTASSSLVERAASATPPQTASSSLVERAALGDRTALRALESKTVSERDAEEVLALAAGHRKEKKLVFKVFGDKFEKTPALIHDRPALAELRRFAADNDTTAEALRMIASLPGHEGADLLYELWTSSVAKNDLTRIAEGLVYSKDVRVKASPALSVALDLRKLDGCDRAREVVGRAVHDGDRRSVVMLGKLTQRRGCGPHKLQDCYACLRKSKALEEAVRVVKTRPEPKL